MAIKTTTVYACDGCDETCDRRDLRRFTLIEADMDNKEIVKGRTELCTTCESDLHSAMRALWPEKAVADFEGIVRP